MTRTRRYRSKTRLAKSRKVGRHSRSKPIKRKNRRTKRLHGSGILRQSIKKLQNLFGKNKGFQKLLPDLQEQTENKRLADKNLGFSKI